MEASGSAPRTAASAGFDPDAPKYLPVPSDLPFIVSEDITDFKFLAEGANGAVYSGWRRSTSRRVAVKFAKAVFPPNTAENDMRASALMKEAQATANVRHDFVVSILGLLRSSTQQPAGTYGDGVVMELMEGSLQQLSRSPDCDTLTLLSAIEAAASALEWLHGRAGGAVVHGDVKPANILYSDGGATKLTDFGFAQRYEAATPETAAGTAGGTLEFTAPEILSTPGMGVTPEADVYAFAVTVWALLARSTPYEGLTDPARHAEEVKKYVCGKGRPDIKRLDQYAIPADVVALVERGWHDDPRQRRTMAEFAAGLRDALARAGLGARYALPAWSAATTPYPDALRTWTPTAPLTPTLLAMCNTLMDIMRTTITRRSNTLLVADTADARAVVAAATSQQREAGEFKAGVFYIDAARADTIHSSVHVMAAWLQIPWSEDTSEALPVRLVGAVFDRFRTLRDWCIVLEHADALMDGTDAADVELIDQLAPELPHGVVVCITSSPGARTWRKHARSLDDASATGAPLACAAPSSESSPPEAAATASAGVRVSTTASGHDEHHVEDLHAWRAASNRVHYSLLAAVGSEVKQDAKRIPFASLHFLQELRKGSRSVHFLAQVSSFSQHKLIKVYDGASLRVDTFTNTISDQLLKQTAVPADAQLAQVYAFAEEAAPSRKLCLIMELLSRTVYQVATVRPRASMREIMFALKEGCTGLIALHSASPAWVHNNIHVGSLMMDMHGSPKLCGLSHLARVGDRTFARHMFSAPEVLAGGGFASLNADVFSFALLCCACILRAAVDTIQAYTVAAADVESATRMQQQLVSELEAALTAEGCEAVAATACASTTAATIFSPPHARCTAHVLGRELMNAHASLSRGWRAEKLVRGQRNVDAPFPSQLSRPIAAVGGTWKRIRQEFATIEAFALPAGPSQLRRAASANDAAEDAELVDGSQDVQVSAAAAPMPASGPLLRRGVSLDTATGPRSASALFPSSSGPERALPANVVGDNMVVLVGQSGVGKSTAIARYCFWAHGTFFEAGILYVNATSVDILQAQVHAMAAALQIPRMDRDTPLHVVADAIHSTLMGARSNWLVVLDNLDDLTMLATPVHAPAQPGGAAAAPTCTWGDILEKIGPSTPRGRVLVSSRADDDDVRAWRPQARLVSVGVLTEREAVEALLRHAASAGGVIDDIAVKLVEGAVFDRSLRDADAFWAAWRSVVGCAPASSDVDTECAAIKWLACNWMQRLPAALALVGIAAASAARNGKFSFTSYRSAAEHASDETELEADEVSAARAMLVRWLEQRKLQSIQHGLDSCGIVDTDMLIRASEDVLLRACGGDTRIQQQLLYDRRINRPRVHGVKLVTPAFTLAMQTVAPPHTAAESDPAHNEFTALQALAVCFAVIAPDSVPPVLQARLCAELAVTFSLSPEVSKALLATLVRLRILTSAQDGSINMHRLNQSAAWGGTRSPVARAHALTIVAATFRALAAGRRTCVATRKAVEIQLLAAHARVRHASQARFRRLLQSTGAGAQLYYSCMLDTAWLSYVAGVYDGAESYFEEIVGASPGVLPRLHLDVLSALEGLSAAQHAQYKYAHAQGHNEDLLQRLLECPERDDGMMAETQLHLGHQLRQQNIDMDRALALQVSACDIRRRQHASHHCTDAELAHALSGCAMTLQRQGNAADATRLLRDATQLTQDVGEGSVDEMNMLFQLSITLANTNNASEATLQEAVACSKKGLQMAQLLVSENHIKVAFGLRSLSTPQRKLGMLPEALATCAHALRIHDKLDAAGKNKHEKARLLAEYSRVLLTVGDASEARKAARASYENVVANFADKPGTARAHLHSADALMQEAMALEGMRETATAVEVYRDCCVVFENATVGKPPPTDLVYARERIAVLEATLQRENAPPGGDPGCE